MRARYQPCRTTFNVGVTAARSRTADGTTVHLPAVTRHDTQTALAQRPIAAKSNEIPRSHPCCPGRT